MAIVVKSKNKQNQSQKFSDYQNHFTWLKQTTLIAMAVEFFILIFLIILTVSVTGITWLGIVSALVLLFLLRMQDQQLTDFQKLMTYKAYSERGSDERALARGHEGEEAFAELTLKMLDDEFVVLENIYLPHNEQYLQQIDSLIIGPSGSLYVIEVKNWYGVISGDINDRRWFTENDQRKSPYYENQYHVDTLQRLLDQELDQDVQIRNLVVNMEPASHFNICKFDKLEHLIYEDAEELHRWIGENEDRIGLKRVEKQVQLACALLDLHFAALSQVEVEINRDLLEKYDLLDVPSFATEPQFG